MINRKTIPIILLVLISTAIIYVYYSKIIDVKEIEIKLVRADCASESQIRDQSNILGQNILLINNQQIEKNLTEKFICIKSVRYLRNSLNKVTLEVAGRNPAAVVAILKTSADQNLADLLLKISTSTAEASFSAIWNLSSMQEYIVDDQGIIFAQNDNKLNLSKLLLWGEDLNIGKKLDSLIIKKSNLILEKIKSLGVNADEGRIYSLRIFLINSKPKLIFSLERDVEYQLAALQLIIEKAKIGGVNIEMIDLRFDKPIIRYGKR